MKRYFLILLLFTINVCAQNISHYLYIPKLKIVQLISFNQTDNTANIILDNNLTSVSLYDLSESVPVTLNDKHRGEKVLVLNPSFKFCYIQDIFLNDYFLLGCQGKKLTRPMGLKKPKLDQIIVTSDKIIFEVKSHGDWNIGDIAKLVIKTDSLDVEYKVRVVALFSTGEALVEKDIHQYLYSSLGSDTSLQKVKLEDLEKN